MRRSGKVARPATAAVVVVPERVPLEGLAPRAIVTLPPKPVAVLPKASRALTCTAGAIALPWNGLLGWTMNASCDGAPAVTSKLALAPLAAPGAVAASVYAEPLLSIVRSGNVATPATAGTVRLPVSVP